MSEGAFTYDEDIAAQMLSQVADRGSRTFDEVHRDLQARLRALQDQRWEGEASASFFTNMADYLNDVRALSMQLTDFSVWLEDSMNDVRDLMKGIDTIIAA